jgi:hypothetical protein
MLIKRFGALLCCILGAITSFAMIPRLCTTEHAKQNGLKSIKPPVYLKKKSQTGSYAVFAKTRERRAHTGTKKNSASRVKNYRASKRSSAIDDKFHLADGVYVMLTKEYENGMKKIACTTYQLPLTSENDQNLIKFVKDVLVVDPLKSAVTNVVIFIFAPCIERYKRNLNDASSHVDLSERYTNYVRVLIENNIDDSKGVRIVCVSLPAEPCFS